jgi:hypothetical protein
MPFAISACSGMTVEESLRDDAVARRRRAADAILAYLARHPRAADTEHGIWQWWLPQMGVDVPREDVHEALKALHDAGRVREALLPDGTRIYRAP